MANIQLQRGQKQQVDVTYKLAGATSPLDLTSGFDAELVIRKKRGDNFMGQIIDVLRHGATSPASSEADTRIIFPSYNSSNPNIELHWNTDQASLLPNEAIPFLNLLTSYAKSSKATSVSELFFKYFLFPSTLIFISRSMVLFFIS